MSYNRGNMRRDVGRRSNDFGGGGNRRGGNYYDNYNSPWEGGMVPGRGSGGSGLLPAPGQSDLLSQLTSPEAQLALASNLINKLINQQQQSVPPLLNMGNMNSGGNRMGSFNDGYGNTRNFQDRRRGRMDQRRTEPYNKSGMNRRNMGNDRRNLGRSPTRNNDRKNSVGKSPKIQKEEIKKDAEKPNGDVNPESTDDDSKREDGKEDEEGEGGKKKDPKVAAPPIPAALLYCHVCSKNMWDETSFNKHLNGRPHQLMMDGMSEKYKLKVDLLRHEMRLAEQQREMELERKQRQGMKVFNHPREYCAMCDLHFYGNLIPHRKNLHHQKLKSFLHPKCSHCNKEFSTRQEWDDHRLTFAHLKKVAEFRRATKPDIKDDEFDIDELVCPDTVNCGDMVSKELPLASGHPSDDTVGELKEDLMKERDDVKKDTKDEDGKTDEKDEEKEKEEAKKAEDMAAAQGADIEPSKLPKYNSANCVGKDLVVPATGFICRVCNRFIPGQDDFQFHCRTLTHYTNYCNMIRAKARVTGRRKRTPGKKDEKGDEEKTDADDSMSGEVKQENAGEDDEGNWKRRKTGAENPDESMETETEEKVADESKDDVADGVWEEGADAEGQKDAEEEQEEETSSPRAKRGAKAAPAAAPAARARRGGRRGK